MLSDNLLGDFYPFITLHSASLDISDQKKFIEKNAKSLYGLANIDYWGWKRTRPKDALNLLDVDLSRRVEYSFYITPSASLEIDSSKRMEQIKTWARKTAMNPELLHLKLLFERILDLEVLRIQHYMMAWLDMEITYQAISKQAKYLEIARLRKLISDGLNDFYNIRSQNKGHVSGTDWIDYGQKKMGIVRLHDNLKERIESLEMQYDVFVRLAEFQLSAVLSLLSVFLSATASNQIVEMIANIPYFHALGFDNWKWLFSLSLFSVFVAFSGAVFFITTRMVRSGSQ